MIDVPVRIYTAKIRGPRGLQSLQVKVKKEKREKEERKERKERKEKMRGKDDAAVDEKELRYYSLLLLSTTTLGCCPFVIS